MFLRSVSHFGIRFPSADASAFRFALSVEFPAEELKVSSDELAEVERRLQTLEAEVDAPREDLPTELDWKRQADNLGL